MLACHNIALLLLLLMRPSSSAAAAAVIAAGYWNGSLVAVKVLEQVAGDFNPRTSLEPLLHHRLSHPNIVAMFDVCTQVSMPSW
jgi:hypothetical protein